MSLEIFKATAMAKELKQRLALALSNVAIVEAQDSLNYPTLFLSTGSAVTDDRIALVIRHDSVGNSRVDGIGQPQVNYTPHKIDVVMGRDSSTAMAIDSAFRSQVLMACARCGSPIEVKRTAANADDITDDSRLEAAAWAGLDKDFVMEYDALNPLTSQM